MSINLGTQGDKNERACGKIYTKCQKKTKERVNKTPSNDTCVALITINRLQATTMAPPKQLVVVLDSRYGLNYKPPHLLNCHHETCCTCDAYGRAVAA